MPQRSIKEPVQGFCAHGVLRLAERSAQQGGEGVDLLAINQVRDDPSAQLALRAESKAKPVATYQPGCQRSQCLSCKPLSALLFVLPFVVSFAISFAISFCRLLFEPARPRGVRGLSIAGGRLIWTATLYRK